MKSNPLCWSGGGSWGGDDSYFWGYKASRNWRTETWLGAGSPASWVGVSVGLGFFTLRASLRTGASQSASGTSKPQPT